MARDYSNYDKETLIKHIYELEKQLKSNKYGLYWDRSIEQEKVVEQCLNNIPILIRDENKSIINKNQINNILIEGDNYHALFALKMLAGNNNLVDIVYIDPPYNTGEKDFVYNDNYVDKEDGFRHSKWLSFMEKRLVLARELMKEDGVIFLSIGDDEVNNVGMLLAKIFGESNYIGLLPRIVKKSGKTTTTIAKNHDFLYIYAKNKELVSFAKQSIERDDSKMLKDEYYEERGLYKLSQTLDYNSLTYSSSMDYPLTIDNVTYYPGTSKEEWEKRQRGEHGKFDWTWRWSQSRVNFGLKNGFVVIKSGKTPRIYTKTYTKATIDLRNGEYIIVNKDDNKNYASIEFVENEYSNDNAKKELATLGLENAFDFPKPSSLIKTCIQMVGKQNATILDFFAGSGTTGQAIMELNKEDGGNRKFILCTNNENNICEEVTYKRITNVINGYASHDPIPSNFLYFKTDFVEDNGNSDQAKYLLVERVNELLCIKEDIFNLQNESSNNTYYHYCDNNRHMFIYTDIYSEKLFNEFVELINNTNGEKIVYIYSNDNYVDELITKDIDGVVKPIPSKIYEIYKEIVEDIKTGGM